MFGSFLAVVWYIFTLIQVFLGYGSAYRQTKAGGDNGIALYGWLLAYSFAAIIPGLGIYLWRKSKELE